MPDMEIYHQALNARDARFDGIFFVGITSTGIYCRPVCPAKVSYPNRRRFFTTAAAAEQAGYRPCLRCRPELAPGRAVLDAVPRLATIAAHRISAGALNGRGVPDLARELGVSERHLRRALEREIGVSPVELAQTCRLLLAKRLLAETSLPVTRIAFASGFQSLRRFNAIFRERYRMSPVALRRGARATETHRPSSPETDRDYVRLSLAYRAPFDWAALMWFLERGAIPGVEMAGGRRYCRTVSLGGRSGVVSIEYPRAGRDSPVPPQTQSLTVAVSATLLPVLMPLLVRIRQLLDLDAEPAVVDHGLTAGGLGSLVQRHPGLRIPGVLDGFEAVLRVVVPEPHALVQSLGRRLENVAEGLSLLLPDAARVAEAGPTRLVALGIPLQAADVLSRLARAMAEGRLRLEQGCDVVDTREKLLAVDQVTDDMATRIIMRALPWPDAIPLADPMLVSAAGIAPGSQLQATAERWRPWRAYAAYHLWLHGHEQKPAQPSRGAGRGAPTLAAV